MYLVMPCTAAISGLHLFSSVHLLGTGMNTYYLTRVLAQIHFLKSDFRKKNFEYYTNTAKAKQ